MNIRIAREIVLGYLNRARLSHDEKIIEIASVSDDDKYLLEHINVMIEVLNKAKKELEENNDKS